MALRARGGGRWRRDRRGFALDPPAAHVARRDPRGGRRDSGTRSRGWRANRSAGLLCRFDGGTVAVFDALLAPGPLGPEPLFRITGTKGELTIEGIGRVKLYDGSEPRGTVVGNGNYLQSYEGELADFAAVVLDGVAPGRRTRAVARRAARRARDVPLGGDRSLGVGLGGRSMTAAPTFDFTGAAVLVTGGTAGIGHGIARGVSRRLEPTVTITGTRPRRPDYDTDLARVPLPAVPARPTPTRSPRSPRASTVSTSW